LGTILTGRPRLSAREGGGGWETSRAGGLGQGEGSWVAWRKRKRERRLVGLGRAGREGREEKAGWAWAARSKKREKKNREWAGPNLKKRDKKNCIQMHLKFKFKWKTNNKTMQYRMKCTKPIFPYISFYG
jgi:hypothetical protein